MSVNLTTKLHLSHPVYMYLLHTKTQYMCILLTGSCDLECVEPPYSDISSITVLEACRNCQKCVPAPCSPPGTLQPHGGKLGGSRKGSSRDDKNKPLVPDSEVGGERSVEITGLFGCVSEERSGLSNESVRPVTDLDPDPTSVGETDVVPS